MRRLHTDSQVQEMARKYIAGASLPQLAREYGGAHITVRSALLRAGVTMRGPGRIPWRNFTPDQQADIIGRWRAGESQTAIAVRLGTDQTVISRFLRANDIEPCARPYNLRGEQHPQWRGGIVDLGPYRAVLVDKDSPYASMRNSTGYVLEHRLVMAQVLGRSLTRHETIHHINGNTRDNRAENLQLRQGRHGVGVAARCRDCGSHNVEMVALA